MVPLPAACAQTIPSDGGDGSVEGLGDVGPGLGKHRSNELLQPGMRTLRESRNRGKATSALWKCEAPLQKNFCLLSKICG